MNKPRVGSEGRFRVWLPVVMLAGIVGWAAVPAEETQAPGEFAELGVCAECHQEQADALVSTEHGKRAFTNLSDDGCQSCHGPAAAHVDDSDNEKLRPRIDDLAPREIADRCQQCHAGGGHMFWQGSRHSTAGVTCTDCHSVHSYASDHGQLKTRLSMDTCFGCHQDIRVDTMRASHHPIREGKITCNDCHEPHGTPNDNNISTASVNEKCFECHAEKRGPFLWEHPPVREDCLSCHTPHGSNHQKLQRTSVPYLCQQCHANTRHPGTLYDATRLPGASRASNRVFERACVNCHSAIHGSNHPSGPYLGR